MAKTVRINDLEDEAIRKKAIEINKKLVEYGKAPVKDTELLHKILINCIKNIYLDDNIEIKSKGSEYYP